MIDRATVDHVAHLARLGVSDAEAEQLRGQLSAILEYVDQLAELEDRKAADSRSGPIELALRPDIVTPSLPREAVLANAPEVVAGHFSAPPVLD